MLTNTKLQLERGKQFFCMFFIIVKVNLDSEICFRSTIIDHIGNFVEDDHGATISYFYFDYKDISKRDSRKAIETLIVSMSYQSPAALDYVEDISKKYREFNSQCTFQTLCSILKKCLEFQQRNFIILDALDECNDREELLHFLVELSKSESSRLNLLMSSRREADIQRQLDHLPQITLAEASNAHDIDLYIQSRLQEMVNGKKLKLRDPNLQEEIFQCLTSRANGMYVSQANLNSKHTHCLL